jgi:hypothetical protein
MSNSKSWVLPSGYTFFAMTLGGYSGSWAKATDPVTAACDAASDYNSGCEYPAAVFMIKDEKVHLNNATNELEWERGYPPVPIGLFKIEVEYDDMDEPTYEVKPHQGENNSHDSFMQRWIKQTLDRAN